jgi:hypothetical protein
MLVDRRLLPVLVLSALWLWSCPSWYTPSVAPSVPQECPVVGTWQGIVPGGIMTGRVVTFVFQPDGTATGSVSTIRVNSSYTRTGDLFEIVDNNGVPAIAACPANQLGRYTLSFSSSCGTVEVVGADDQCTHRRATLAGLRAERR